MTLQQCIDVHNAARTAPAALTQKGAAIVALHHLAAALEPLDGEELGDVLDRAAELLRPALERAGSWPVTA